MQARRETIEALVALSAFGPRSAAIKQHIAKLQRRFARYDLPLDDLRKLLDENLGPRSLTEELRRLREH